MTDARLKKPPEANNQAGITEITAAKSVLLTGHMAHHPQAFPKLHTLYISKSAFPHDWGTLQDDQDRVPFLDSLPPLAQP